MERIYCFICVLVLVVSLNAGAVATTLLFDGAQYVSIYLPNETDSTAEDISLQFRTQLENGLLLITVSSQAPYSIQMYLEHGSFKVTISQDVMFETLSLGKGLNDGQWHTVIVKRSGQNLELAVDDSDPVTGYVPFFVSTMKIEQIVLGSPDPFRQGSENYRGSVKKMNVVRFVGEMQKFVFNGNRYFDVAKNKNQDNIDITARFENDESVTKDPVTFETESSYAVMPPLQRNDVFSIYFKFKTSKRFLNGLIMFHGRSKGYFIGLELFQGYLYYIYNMGSGPVRIRFHTQEPLNDNKWHDVTLRRTNIGRHIMRVDSNSATVTVDNVKGCSTIRLGVIGPMYLGGVIKYLNNSLPGQIMSHHGFIGCMASLTINSHSVNILEKASGVENRIFSGCSSSEKTCSDNTCYNGGRCKPNWRSYACDCDMTSFTGPECTDDSVTYKFGIGRGLVTFEYEPSLRPSTNSIPLALGIKTIQYNAILVRVDSANSHDYIQMELVLGKVVVLYDMGQRATVIGETYSKLNDNRYHVIKFRRQGRKATLQVDNGDTVSEYSMNSGMEVFNDQARVCIGGRKTTDGEIEHAYHGTVSGLFFKGHRILDYLKGGDPRITSVGDLTLVNKSEKADLNDIVNSVKQFKSLSEPALHGDCGGTSSHDIQSTQGTTGTTPKQSTDDIIISWSGSGSGALECIESDDGGLCNISTLDEIITIGPVQQPDGTSSHDIQSTQGTTGTTPQQSRDDIITSWSGSGVLECIESDDENLCIPSADENITPIEIGPVQQPDNENRISQGNGHLDIFLIIAIGGVLFTLIILVILVMALYKFRSRHNVVVCKI